jgi:thiol-disulfide isomerase/thioredoxin
MQPMRPARTVLLALAASAAALAVAGGVLVSSRGRPPADTAGTPAIETVDQTPLGRFIPASPPRPAPQVSFSDAGGKTVSLADFDGKVVLLNLWATWCAPCRREMPSLARLQTRFGDKIAVLAVSQDLGGNKVVAPFIAKLGLSAIKIYLDPKSTVAKAFKVDGLPTSFVIDRQGRVRGRVEGEADWNGPKMLAAIEPLLGRDGIVKTSFPQAHP